MNQRRLKMNKKQEEITNKMINRYFRNMQLEMKRYAQEISLSIFKLREQDFVKEINNLQKQLVKSSVSYEVLEQLKNKYAVKPKNE